MQTGRTLPSGERFSSPESEEARATSEQAGSSSSSSRKAPSRAGTRTVSTLSAAQLERKRANDREAQRAIRQRTKEHIENLERQLKSSQDRVAELAQRNKELEEQNAILHMRQEQADLPPLTKDPEYQTLASLPSPERFKQHRKPSPQQDLLTRAGTSELSRTTSHGSLYPTQWPVEAPYVHSPSGIGQGIRRDLPSLPPGLSSSSSSTGAGPWPSGPSGSFGAGSTGSTHGGGGVGEPQSSTYPPVQSGSPLPPILSSRASSLSDRSHRSPPHDFAHQSQYTLHSHSQGSQYPPPAPLLPTERPQLQHPYSVPGTARLAQPQGLQNLPDPLAPSRLPGKNPPPASEYQQQQQQQRDPRQPPPW